MSSKERNLTGSGRRCDDLFERTGEAHIKLGHWNASAVLGYSHQFINQDLVISNCEELDGDGAMTARK